MQSVLKKIKPGQDEISNFNSVTKEFLTKLNSKLSGAKAILGGSGAKDTWLSGSHDVDLFVQFDYKTFSQESHLISEHLEKAVKKAFPKYEIERLHGSRDYFQINYKNLIFEVVPIIKISKSEDALNITDISPLHAIWVNKNAKSLKDDIRLAKQFCKANKLYGAESHITAFSGYVLEILVSYYGGFEKLLKASLKWKDKEVIDPEKYHKNKHMALFNLNQSKLNSPIIVIDPVDQTRNAAAAFSKEKLKLFQKVANQYLKSPAEKFFVKDEISKEKLSKENGHLVFLEVIPLIGKRDVIGVKLLKSFEFIKKELTVFKIKKADWDWDNDNNAIFYFLLKEDKLSKDEIRNGPPLDLKEHVKKFKKSNKNTFTKNGKLYATVKIEFPKLSDFVQNLIKQKYVKEKIKKIKLIVS
jgi:tRNA nucleotidyltransferase (CCA-adding enzyme)